jgi:hypothetical protein
MTNASQVGLGKKVCIRLKSQAVLPGTVPTGETNADRSEQTGAGTAGWPGRVELGEPARAGARDKGLGQQAGPGGQQECPRQSPAPGSGPGRAVG